MELTPERSDVLNELLNIAMGKTASILSQMIGRSVDITIPKSLLVSYKTVQTLFEEKYKKNIQEDMLGVTINFCGNCSGSTTLFFEQHQGKTLVDKLLAHQELDDWYTEEAQRSNNSENTELFSDSDREALVEVGNMLINGLMGTISNLLGMFFDYSVPELQVPFDFESSGSPFHASSQKDTLVLETHFIDQTEEIEGHLIIVFSIGEFTETLLTAIDRLAMDVTVEDF